MIEHTYDEWRSIGFGVLKGQHSARRDDAGIPLFTELQVRLVHQPLCMPIFTSNEERGFPPGDD